MTAATFDSVRKVNGNLSGGNLTVTSIGAGGVAASRFAQQNFYAEFTCTTSTGTPRIGFSSSTAPQTTSLENALYSLAYEPSGAVKVNNVTLATIAAWAANQRVDMSVNLSLALVWFRVAGGNWNNDVIANQNPATNTGGIDFSSMTIRGTVAPAVSYSLTGTVFSAVFTAASWAGAAPAGYASIDSVSLLSTEHDPDLRFVTPVTPDLSLVVKGEPKFETRIYKAFQPAGAVKTVSGVIRELGVAVPGKRVDVYNRNDGSLIGSTVSDGAGAWSVPTLDQTKVRVVATDQYNYNSLAADNVTPA